MSLFAKQGFWTPLLEASLALGAWVGSLVDTQAHNFLRLPHVLLTKLGWPEASFKKDDEGTNRFLCVIYSVSNFVK